MKLPSYIGDQIPLGRLWRRKNSFFFPASGTRSVQ